MKTSRLIVVGVSLLALALNCTSQTITWSDPERLDVAVQYLRPLGTHSGQLQLVDWPDHVSEQNVMSYDFDGKMVSRKPFTRKLKRKALQLHTYIETSSGLFAIGKLPSYGEQIRSAYAFKADEDGNIPLQGQKLFEVPKNPTQWIGSDFLTFYETQRRDALKFLISPNKEKVAYISHVRVDPDEAEEDEVHVTVELRMLDAELNLLSTHSVDLPHLEVNFQLQSALLLDNGDVLISGAVWESSQHRTEGNTNSGYEGYLVSKGEIMQTWRVEMESQMVQQAILGVQNDAVFLAGLYHNKKESDRSIHGTFVVNFSNDGNCEKWATHEFLGWEIQDMNNGEKRGPGAGIDKLHLHKVLYDENSGTVVVLAERVYPWGYERTTYIKKGMAISQFNLTNHEHQATTVLPVNYSSSSVQKTRAHISYNSESQSVYLLFYNKPDKSEIAQHGKDPVVDLVGINTRGTIFHNKPVHNAAQTRITLYHNKTGYGKIGELLLVGAKGRRKLTVGVLELPVD